MPTEVSVIRFVTDVVGNIMVIRGLQKTTLLDYPGNVAATIFLGGCNMRCPFCHNMDIVAPDLCEVADVSSLEEYSFDEVMSFLVSRRKLLDGVCITGGEPTINPELPDFICGIKELGLKVKLDTNGTNPDMVKELVEKGFVDYIAMDVKSSLREYGRVCGVEGIKVVPIKETIDFLIGNKMNGFDYEFRTTVAEPFHTREVMEEIGQLISGAGKYFIQNFRDSEYVPNHSLGPVLPDKLEQYVDILKKYVQIVEIRGE